MEYSILLVLLRQMSMLRTCVFEPKTEDMHRDSEKDRNRDEDRQGETQGHGQRVRDGRRHR